MPFNVWVTTDDRIEFRGAAAMLRAFDGKLSKIRRIVLFTVEALVVIWFAILAIINVVIVCDLYRPPEGPWPGWTPLIEADLLYGAIGVAGALAIRWAWQRRLRCFWGNNCW